MEARSEPRAAGHESASVEFTPGSDQLIYQFKLRDFSSKGFGIMVKKDSKVLKNLKKGDVLEMKYHPDTEGGSPVFHKTRIQHISEPDPGTWKGHMLVGLLIVD